MWTTDDLPDLALLSPIEQLWIIAQAVQDNAGPADYVEALHSIADRLQDLSWWMQETERCVEASHG